MELNFQLLELWRSAFLNMIFSDDMTFHSFSKNIFGMGVFVVKTFPLKINDAYIQMKTLFTHKNALDNRYVVLAYDTPVLLTYVNLIHKNTI
jgi:hypothetical protein